MTRLIQTTALTSLLALAACGDDDGSLSDAGPGSSFDAEGRDTGTTGFDGRVGVDSPTGRLDAPGSDLCPGGSQCTDGADNDGDGMVDGFDVECTGVCDNDEGSFATGIPGDNRDPMWQDCFYDGNSGAGDDGCRYRTECLTGDLPASDRDCMLSMDCIDFCGSRTPNGCDCFGCCEIITGSSSVFITLGPSCSIDSIDDTTACPRCVQSTECVNECGECEICPGRTAADLPASCRTDGGMGYTCDMGTTCAADADCPTDYYCSLGCCLPFII
jgi:hypothetical protein